MKRNGTHCGGGRGRERLRRRVLRRREERAAPPAPVAAPPDLLVRLEAVAKALSVLPPPWGPDIDNPILDPAGRVVDGYWTGKIYAQRRGSWCLYLAGPDSGVPGVSTTPTVIALCELRNALPELLAAVRAGRRKA